MPSSNELKASYEAVLQDLETQHGDLQQQVAGLQARLKDIHHSIATITKCLSSGTSSAPLATPSSPSRKYANMSVRWAILDLLSDSQYRTTAEIAETVLALGIRTRAANFANNVSAVLTTTMKEQHNEVLQNPDGKWGLTERGRGAIEHIRTTPKFRYAMQGRAFDARF